MEIKKIPFIAQLDANILQSRESKNTFLHSATPLGGQVVLTDQTSPSLTYVTGTADKKFQYSPFNEELNPYGNCHYALTFPRNAGAEIYGAVVAQAGLSSGSSKGGFAPAKSIDYTENFASDNGWVTIDSTRYISDYKSITQYSEKLNGVTDFVLENTGLILPQRIFKDDGTVEEQQSPFAISTYMDNALNILQSDIATLLVYRASITRNETPAGEREADTFEYVLTGTPTVLSMIDALTNIERAKAFEKAKAKDSTAKDLSIHFEDYFDGTTTHKVPKEIVFTRIIERNVIPTILDYKHTLKTIVINDVEEYFCVGNTVGVINRGVGELGALVVTESRNTTSKIPIASISAWNALSKKCNHSGQVNTYTVNRYPISLTTVSKTQWRDQTRFANGFQTMSVDPETMEDKTSTPYKTNHQYTFNVGNEIVYYTNWARIARRGFVDHIYKTTIGSGDILDIINAEYGFSGFYPFDNFNYAIDRLFGNDPEKYGKPYVAKRTLDKVIDEENPDDVIYLLDDQKVSYIDDDGDLIEWEAPPTLMNIVACHSNSVYTLLTGSGYLYLVLRDGSGYYSVPFPDAWISYIDDERLIVGTQFAVGKTTFHDVEILMPLPKPRQLVYDFKFARYAFIGCQTRYMAKGGIISKV